MRCLVAFIVAAPILARAGVQFGVAPAIAPPLPAITSSPTSTTVLARFPFSTIGCLASGAAAGAKGEAITVSRALAALYVDDSGAIQSCSANQARVAADGGDARRVGLLVEPTRSSDVDRTEDFPTSPWTLEAGVTAAADNASCPLFNGTRMDRIDNTGAGAATTTDYQIVSISSSSGPYTHSANVATTIGTGPRSVGLSVPTGNIATCACTRSDGGACTGTISANKCIGTTTASTTSVRVATTATFVSANTSVYVWVSPGDFSSTRGIACFGGSSLEAAPYGSTYVGVVTTGSATRNADVVSASWPGSALNHWCVRATATPEGYRSWSAATGAVWSTGTTGGANSARLQANASGALVLDVFDGSGGQKTLTYTHAFTDGSVHTIEACAKSGDLSLAIDGTAVAGTGSGVGTGIWSAAPSTLYFGTLSATGSEWGGYLSNVLVCKGTCR